MSTLMNALGCPSTADHRPPKSTTLTVVRSPVTATTVKAALVTPVSTSSVTDKTAPNICARPSSRRIQAQRRSVSTTRTFLISGDLTGGADYPIFPLFWKYEDFHRHRLPCRSCPRDAPQYLSLACPARTKGASCRSNRPTSSVAGSDALFSPQRTRRSESHPATQKRALHLVFREPGQRESSNRFLDGKLLRWAWWLCAICRVRERSSAIASTRRKRTKTTAQGVTQMQGRYNVLFLCTGNSARSIMAEAILNHKGRPNFTAYSAGSHSSGFIRPEALRQLEIAHLPTKGLRSKNWDEFAKPGAPEMNFVFTVCDNAAKEVCPVWPGQPVTAHWGVPDPAAVTGTPEQIEKAFREAFMILDRRINLLLCLPLSSLDMLAIKREIDRIGQQ